MVATNLCVGATIPVEGFVCLRFVEKTGEIESAPFFYGDTPLSTWRGDGGEALDELRVTDNLLQAVNTNLAEILAYLLGQEGEEVDKIL